MIEFNLKNLPSLIDRIIKNSSTDTDNRDTFGYWEIISLPIKYDIDRSSRRTLGFIKGTLKDCVSRSIIDHYPMMTDEWGKIGKLIPMVVTEENSDIFDEVMSGRYEANIEKLKKEKEELENKIKEIDKKISGGNNG